MPTAVTARCRFLWDTQLHRKRGVLMVAIVSVLALGGLYDLGVAQAVSNPEEWPRFYDLMSFMPWWAWVIALLGTLVIFMFEGGFRASRSKDETILALKRELADREVPSALPLTVTVDPPESGSAGTYRFRVHNPASVPITNVYGKYLNYRVIKRSWRRWPYLKNPAVPVAGTELLWGAKGTSQTVDIGADSSEYLNFGFVKLWSFMHHGPGKKWTYTLNGGEYEFILEIGSKTSGTPIKCTVRHGFSKRGFDVEIIPPTPDTEPGSPQATP